MLRREPEPTAGAPSAIKPVSPGGEAGPRAAAWRRGLGRRPGGGASGGGLEAGPRAAAWRLLRLWTTSYSLGLKSIKLGSEDTVESHLQSEFTGSVPELLHICTTSDRPADRCFCFLQSAREEITSGNVIFRTQQSSESEVNRGNVQRDVCDRCPSMQQ
ncbi:hypothetical protein EYF80_042543 [Liparis tanakae]|uniref:Uncharacterized protein n=1 Tax=Liparis tanakae TaxID=230148 RepID=A0A4Z2G197_9TELE|nr:hypothetical protein EYF80_042543 [Liparis tanakae]